MISIISNADEVAAQLDAQCERLRQELQAGVQRAMIALARGRKPRFFHAARGARKGGIRNAVCSKRRRALDLPARPFVRTAANEQREMILDELKASVARALR